MKENLRTINNAWTDEIECKMNNIWNDCSEKAKYCFTNICLFLYKKDKWDLMDISNLWIYELIEFVSNEKIWIFVFNTHIHTRTEIENIYSKRKNFISNFTLRSCWMWISTFNRNCFCTIDTSNIFAKTKSNRQHSQHLILNLFHTLYPTIDRDHYPHWPMLRYNVEYDRLLLPFFV